MARGQTKSPGLRQGQGYRPHQSRDRTSCEAPERESLFSQQTANHTTDELAHSLTPSAIGDQSDHHGEQDDNQLEQEGDPQGSENPQPAPSDNAAQLEDNESNGQEAGEANGLDGGLVSVFHGVSFLSWVCSVFLHLMDLL